MGNGGFLPRRSVVETVVVIGIACLLGFAVWVLAGMLLRTGRYGRGG